MKKDIIEQFLEKRMITTYNTKRIYRMNIQTFFKRIDKDIENYLQKTKHDKIESDLRSVYMQFEKEGRPLLSRRTFFNSIKQFMVTKNPKLKDLEFWNTLKMRLKGAEAETIDFVPNLQDIKTVLSHGSTVSRAMFLILSSSGRRIDELLALTPEDIQTNYSPTRVKVTKGYDPSKPDRIKPYTKSKSKRICFISEEATEAYLTWMKERDDYLRSAVSKMKFDKNRAKDINDKRVFPMSYFNVLFIWKRLVKKSGLYETDGKTKRLTLHPHCLRKFFRSYLGDADLSEYLMGHASSGLVKVYRNKKIEDLAIQYNQLMHNVTVFEASPDLTGVHQQLKEKDKEIKELRHQMEIMRDQMSILMTDKLIQLDKKKG